MSQTPAMGRNRTGIASAPDRAREMVTGMEEFPPSAGGDAWAIAEVRIAYAREAEPPGHVPPPSSLADTASAVVRTVTGAQPTLLMDKLGERLAFERTGARLYEGLVSKHRAYGSFDGGPAESDLEEILEEERRHFQLLRRVVDELGGDPTAVTPSANLAASATKGFPAVIADPRTTLLDGLEVVLVAELTDNECWEALVALTRVGGEESLAGHFEQALAREREHLARVRAWVAAGQGREPRRA
jgi:rubrerythrin